MPITVTFGSFEWDGDKATLNAKWHGITFYAAVLAFLDSKRIIGAGYWRKGKRLYEKKESKESG